MIKLLDLVIAWEIKETEKQIKYQKRGTIRKLRSWGTLGQKTICCVIFVIEKHNKREMEKGFIESKDQIVCMDLTWTQNQIRLSLQKQNI